MCKILELGIIVAEGYDLQVRLLISTLNSNNFTEPQHKIVDIVEKEIEQKIPEETKQIIYSKSRILILLSYIIKL